MFVGDWFAGLEIDGQENNESERVVAELSKKEDEAVLTARLNRIICLEA